MALRDNRVGLIDLDNASLRRIYSFLSADDLARGMSVHTQLYGVLKDDLLWKKACEVEWGLTSAICPHDHPLDSYRDAFGFWQTHFAQYPRSLTKRAASTWTRIKQWFGANIPKIAASLGRGCSEEQLDNIEQELNCKLPPDFRLMYRFHNGQQRDFDHSFDERFMQQQSHIEGPLPVDASSRHGLFGGYIFYDASINTSLFPCERIIYWNRTLARHIPNNSIVIGSSAFNKMLFLNLADDQITCLDRTRRPSPVSPAHVGMLGWMEEFAARLQRGVYQPASVPLSLFGQEDGFESEQGLNLFPQVESYGMRELITGGLRIRVSALFVPEQSCLRARTQCLWAYSVRFYLLQVEEQRALWPPLAGPFRPKLSVQLESRSWNIWDSQGRLMDQITGAGVVGEFPLLTPGEEYVYQSCTTSSEAEGSMDGHFTFVEGTLGNPEARFNAICPRFEYSVPEFSF